MENWIGIGIWVVMGAVIGLIVKAAMKRPEEQPGTGVIIAVLGAFAAVIGGMLGVGIFHFEDPVSLSVGGMATGAGFAALMAWTYRWGSRAWL
jgi:hypothetical protein